MPCYIFEENISGFPMMDDVGDDLGNVFYYANDGGDIELFRPVYDGDVLTFHSTVQKLTDTTPVEGSPLRRFPYSARRRCGTPREDWWAWERATAAMP